MKVAGPAQKAKTAPPRATGLAARVGGRRTAKAAAPVLSVQIRAGPAEEVASQLERQSGQPGRSHERAANMRVTATG